MREIVEAWRNRYAELYARRWGRELPASNARRIVIAHDSSWSDASLDRLRRQFGADGALVECRLFGEENGSWGEPADYDCLVIAAMEMPPETDRNALRRFIVELVDWCGFVAGIGGGADYLTVEGFAPPTDEEKREIVDRDGRYFACAHRDLSDRLAGRVLERLADARRDRTEGDAAEGGPRGENEPHER